MHKCLPVKSKIFTNTIGDESHCVFCHSSRETIDHLLLDFLVTNQIWNVADPSFAGIFSGFTIEKWISSWFDDDSGGIRVPNQNMIISAGFILWHIWKIRCIIHFDNVNFNVDNIVRLIKKEMQ